MNRVENWATFKCGFWGLFGHDPNESFQNLAAFKVVHLVCRRKKGIDKYFGLDEMKIIH